MTQRMQHALQYCEHYNHELYACHARSTNPTSLLLRLVKARRPREHYTLHAWQTLCTHATYSIAPQCCWPRIPPFTQPGESDEWPQRPCERHKMRSRGFESRLRGTLLGSRPRLQGPDQRLLKGVLLAAGPHMSWKGLRSADGFQVRPSTRLRAGDAGMGHALHS